ncbi:MAG: DNA polymerase III subunit gamma/tau [Alteromonadales bacterium]|nr:DNA polymerase III subunit gamma/tau [Alteromonadales bacterium]
MSYQVLARKWRPQNFSQVVGQQHVLTALSNGLAQNRVHHAYLFSGTRGVGKTTIARILAKSLNCEQGVTATPCGQCEHCVAIDQGRFVDLLEIDAASRTKVDDTRELLDNVQYKPAVGRYKVYLIDEVHMLSKHSFNALLKTLEEPPEYVKFLLATTDPQKLPITVLSRCLQFHLKAILPEQIETQLAFILQHEQATFEHTALNVIAKAADGSMRDALSLTDQALAFGAGNIEYQSVLKMLGTLDNSHLQYLLHFIVSGNVTKVFEKIEEFVALGADFAKLHQELAALCHQIALQQLQAQQANAEKSAIQLLSEKLSPEEVQLYYQIALQGYKDYSFAPNGKVALEMTVMRLLAFKPANYIELDETVLVNSNLPQQQAVEPTPVVVNETANVIEQGVIEQPVIGQPVIESVSSTNYQPESVVQEPQQMAPDNIYSEQNSFSEPPVQPPVQSAEHITAERQPQALPMQDMSPQLVSAETVTEPKSQTVAPVTESISQVTHSRNMLRSHRLKRNESKKSQATTDHIINEPVVAPSQPITVPTIKAPKPVEGIEPVVAAQPVMQVVENEIAPIIEQPQEDEFYNNQFDDNDYDPYAPPVDFQNTASLEALPVTSDTEQATVNLNENSVAKHPFFSEQAFEAVEIDRAKYVEDKLTDSWSLAIQKMQLRGLVKLLAKNSVMKQVDLQIVLTLKAQQQHLLNNSGLCEELQKQLQNFYGAQYSMYIEIGNVDGQLTAFESEMALYDQYLNNAKNAIVEDINIKALVENCGAKVYENSVIPL